MNSESTFESEYEYNIAIIGIDGRFPKAKNLDEFWLNLKQGRECISFFSDEELLASGVDPSELANPNYVKARAVLDDVDLFDARFFGFSPNEAIWMDPQQRLFLECAWTALEDAGYIPHHASVARKQAGVIGVFAGVEMSTYSLNFLARAQDWNATEQFQAMLGNDKDYLATLTSYKLNLQGPSITVQTACSTSLVAIHLACQSLLNGECDIALAGGVSIGVPQKAGYLYQKEGIHSPDGHCRAFDAQAQGTVMGSGVGVVVLKRAEDALTDHDHIYAIIKGSAINNDGSLKAGYTAPSVKGQAKVVTEAMAVADVDPETITYIETHGTGTLLGDPIEAKALTKAFQSKTTKTGFCAIGSLKTNIGHLGAAAGIAGLIKSVLALKHKQLPSSLNFEQPNPKINFADSPFFVNHTLTEWRRGAAPRRAGVSAFGIGGTNAHVVLEEAPPMPKTMPAKREQLLLLSAKSETALETATDNLAVYLEANPQQNLADVAYTYQIGRKSFDHRRMLVCHDIEDAIDALKAHHSARVLQSTVDTDERSVVFVFSGLGEHYVNLAKGLYEHEPIFREQVDRCADILNRYLDTDIREVLYPAIKESDISQMNATNGIDLLRMLGRAQTPANENTQRLNQTYLAQPAVFVIEYALARLWQAWGIQPEALIGHSLGEYVAACLAEVFSLEDALMLVAKRAQLIQERPAGAMLAVPLSEQNARKLLTSELSLAAINGESLCTIAGPREAIAALERHLTAKGIASRQLQTTHAFHSKMMAPIAETFTKLVQSVQLNEPQIPYISNVTGNWIKPAQATNPGYWAEHLCQAVRFADGILTLWAESNPVLLEIGPGQSLSALALQHSVCTEMTNRVALPSLRNVYDQQADTTFLLNTVGKLWLAGVEIDWSQLHAQEQRQRLSLPSYPFERQRYWVETQQQPEPNQISTTQRPIEKASNIKEWFYTPVWQQTPPLAPYDPTAFAQYHWLIFADENGIGGQLTETLQRHGSNVDTVMIGDQFVQLDDSTYTIDPQNYEDYVILLEKVGHFSAKPLMVLHLWSTFAHDGASSRNAFDKIQHLGLYSLILLAQALDRHDVSEPVHLKIISNNTQVVTGEELIVPEKSTVLSANHILPQEYPNMTCQIIDIAPNLSQSWQVKRLTDHLLREFVTNTHSLLTAYRANHRWVKTFDPLQLAPDATRLRKEGVYLISEGLKAHNFVLARYLAETFKAKLILTDPLALPPKEKWQQWQTIEHDQDDIAYKLQQIQALEALGATTLVIQAQTSVEADMEAAVEQAYKTFGTLHGVIHTPTFVNEEALTMIAETHDLDALYPQTQSLYVLEKVLSDKALDFCLLQSSLLSVFGGVGLVSATATTLLADSFAQRHNQLSPVPWFTVNWDLWHLSNVGQPSTGHPTEAVTTLEEGLEAFQWALSADSVTQIAVSPTHLNKRIDHWLTLKSLQNKREAEKLTFLTKHARPNLRTLYVAPETEVEETIAEIWQDLLNVETVGIHDNFFELGGHSLLGAQLISRLQSTFEIDLSLRLLFESPTVEQQALLIEQIIIAELEALSEEEATSESAQ